MRIKLPILTGAIAFTIAGIAVAAPGKAFFSSTSNVLSTISEMVSTSMWDANADTKPVAASTIGKHSNIVATVGQILHNTSANLPVSQSTYVPGASLQAMDYGTINSNPTVVDYGYSGNDNVVNSNSGNSFVGGGGSNWGTVPIKGAATNGSPPSGGWWVPCGYGGYYCGGGLGGSSGGGLGGSSGGGLGGSSGGGLGGSSGGGLGGSSGGGLGSTFSPATFTLSSNGTLTYSVTGGSPVAPVPELGEWLLMLLGFGVVGYVAILRKQKMAFA